MFLRNVWIPLLLVIYWIGVNGVIGVSQRTEAEIRMALQRDSSVQLCGNRLSTAVAIVCQGTYNTFFPPTSTQPSIPWRGKRSARNLLRTYYRKHRRRRGIVGECCWEACSLKTLLSYCG